MRHSKIDLTMSVYTDPKLLDVRGALEALPVLPLAAEREAETVTGTAVPLAPVLAPTGCKRGQAESFVVTMAGTWGRSRN